MSKGCKCNAKDFYKIIEKFLRDKIEAKYMNPPEKIIEIESKELLLEMLEELFILVEESNQEKNESVGFNSPCGT